MRFIAVALLAFLGGCNSISQACTLVFCEDSLTVFLAQTPTGPYSIEVFTQPSGAVYRFDCANPAQCGYAVFSHYTPEQAHVRVTTSAGTREEVVTPHYNVERPNGPNCEPVCRQAQVTVALPG